MGAPLQRNLVNVSARAPARMAVLGAALLVVPHIAAAMPCEPVGELIPICGLQSPEDLELAPDGRHIIFSQMVAGAGLGRLDTADDSVTRLYPAAEPAVAEEGWGSAACPGEPGEAAVFHGIHLSRRGDGRWQLLVVNHGGRESIELLELLPRDNAPPELRWRGCIPAPADTFLNDVVALPDGGLLVTEMFPASAQAWGSFKALLGFDSGRVHRWRPESGFELVPGTGAPLPNGIQLDAEARHFYLNAYLAGEVRKYPLAGGEPLAVIPVPGPDNSNWSPDGRLLVASHRYGWGNLLDGLPPDDGSPVPLRFAIVALDPDSLAEEVLFTGEGPPMGGGTAALVAGEFLYIGSYAGDRMIKVPLAAQP